MATVPSDSAIVIAEQDVDLVNRAGLPNKLANVRPAIKDAGYGFEQKIPADELNLILNNHGLWAKYLEELAPDLLAKDAAQDVRLDALEPDVFANSQSILSLNSSVSDLLSRMLEVEQGFADLTSDFNTLDGEVTTLSAQVVQQQLPVGAILETTVSTNPATLLGYGTWVAYAEGRVTVGYGATTDDRGETINFNAQGAEAGEFKHQLTETELASHAHRLFGATTGSGATAALSGNTVAGDTEIGGYTNSGQGGTQLVEDTGNDVPHNNMQPYVVVYKWTRTA